MRNRGILDVPVIRVSRVLAASLTSCATPKPTDFWCCTGGLIVGEDYTSQSIEEFRAPHVDRDILRRRGHRYLHRVKAGPGTTGLRVHRQAGQRIGCRARHDLSVSTPTTDIPQSLLCQRCVAALTGGVVIGRQNPVVLANGRFEPARVGIGHGARAAAGLVQKERST